MKQPPQRVIDLMKQIGELCTPVSNELGCITITIEIHIQDKDDPEWEDQYRLRGHFHKQTKQ